ncbi:MAG TPA: glycosyltransferase family 2 protein [Armatimonadetes bacterium]|jgi:GT2 family glycosyltransferase|nr:glycosyltransferase family 2 protein [Armatimonadota bacterium]
MKDLSIAIVNWNTSDLLHQCLLSAKESCKGTDYEIIVVDNASSDGSPEMVEEEHPDVLLVRNPINQGFAAACNLAYKYSSGRYFLLLNTDTIVIKSALPDMVGFMDTRPNAGAAGCRLINRDGSLQRSCSCFPGLMTELFDALYLSKIFPKSRLFGAYAMSYWDFADEREVDFAGGSCLIVRREAIEAVGLLDDGFFMYAEEADWCYRMRAGGWKVCYYPGASVIHLGGESAKKYGSQILLHLYTSRNRFLRKHRGSYVAGVHRAIVALGALCRMGAYYVGRAAGRGEPDFIKFQKSLFAWAAGREV